MCPKPLRIGIGDPESLFVEVGRTQNGATQNVSMQAYLHQLTAHEVTYKKTAPRVQINKPDTAKTAVLYVTYCDEGASAQTQLEIQQQKIPAIKQWILSAISAKQKQVQLDIQDTWHPQFIKRDGDKTWYQVSIRVKQQDVDKFLAISAPGKIQFNGPASVKEGIHHLWLKADGQAIPDEGVHDILQKFSGLHLGAFWLRGTWAIRVRARELEEIKKQLGCTEEPAYFLGNCSPEWDVADIQEVLRQINWPAVVAPTDRRWKYGGCTWLVRSAQDPPIWGCPINFGYERRMLRITSARKSRVAPPATPNTTPTFEYSSWNAQWRNNRPHKSTWNPNPGTYAEALMRSAPVKRGAQDTHNNEPQATQMDDDSDLETPKGELKEQMRRLQEQNEAQQKQISELLNQVQALVAQLASRQQPAPGGDQDL